MIKFSKDHVSVNISKKFVTIGLADKILENAEVVTNIRFPEEGDEVSMGDEFIVVETPDENLDIICPISGTVIELNEVLVNRPEMLLDDPERYWLCKISIDDPDELEDLLTYGKYTNYCEDNEDY